MKHAGDGHTDPTSACTLSVHLHLMLQQLPHPTALAASHVQQAARLVPSSLQEFLLLQRSCHSASFAGHADDLKACALLPACRLHAS